MAAVETFENAPGSGTGTGTGAISAEHWKVLSLSTLGGALEFYEFVVFLHMSPVISKLFSASDVAPWLAQLQVLGIYAVGYLVRPLGGTVLAALGDRIGRKRLFGITLLLMALGTLGIGLLPTYAQIGAAAPILLLLCRTGQGLAMGGEFPAAASYVMETVPENRISFAIGLLTVGFGLGSLLAVGVILLLSSQLPQADYLGWGWRVPFLAGGLFGLFSVYLRRSVKESPVFLQMAQAAHSAQRLPFSALFTRYRRELLVAIGLALVSGGLIQTVQLYPVAYFQVEMQWPRALMSSAQMGLTASAMVFTRRASDCSRLTISNRARCIPMHMCTPVPKPRWSCTSRVTSKRSGVSQRRGSRLAPARNSRIFASCGSATPPSLVGLVVVRKKV